ncbi:hypothetical protein [Helicobacter sp. 23-1045]
MSDSEKSQKNRDSSIASQSQNDKIMDGCFTSLTNPVDCHDLLRKSRNDGKTENRRIYDFFVDCHDLLSQVSQ